MHQLCCRTIDLMVLRLFLAAGAVCSAAGSVPEEPHEVQGDSSGHRSGAILGRLHVSTVPDVAQTLSSSLGTSLWAKLSCQGCCYAALLATMLWACWPACCCTSCRTLRRPLLMCQDGCPAALQAVEVPGRGLLTGVQLYLNKSLQAHADLAALARAAGATLLSRPPVGRPISKQPAEFCKASRQQLSETLQPLVLSDAAPASRLSDEDGCSKSCAHQQVSRAWLLDSVAAFKRQPVRRYCTMAAPA